jgi:tRNA pseudouridine55 synthase
VTSGILLLDKPAGLSSNAALQRVRRAYGAAKAGHVGSLDPLATGMLPICLDEATKVAGDALEGRKCYRFDVALGCRTATGDAEGDLIEERPIPAGLDEPTIAAALSAFLGERQQIPPMYSALKRDGQPLYKLARAGMTVERAPRPIRIDRFALLGIAGSRLTLEMLCSKGTYVRTIAEEVGQALGTCAHVASLRRLYVEPFAADAMVTLEAVLAGAESGRPPPLLAPEAALAHLPALAFSARDAERLRQGQRLQAGASPAGRVRLYDDRGAFFGIGECKDDGVVHPRRILDSGAASAVVSRGVSG